MMNTESQEKKKALPAEHAVVNRTGSDAEDTVECVAARMATVRPREDVNEDGNQTDTNDEQQPEKRLKTTDSRTSSLLMDAPDIMKNVYTFLTVKEALQVRRTCRYFRRHDLDLFQYSNMVTPEPKLNPGEYYYQARAKYERALARLLCNLGSVDKLRAALANETLPPYERQDMLWKMVRHSQVDDGKAIELLLQDNACPSLEENDDTPTLLDTVLQKDFVAMAAALQQNEAIGASIQMCATCSTNIGCYTCSSRVECRHVPPRSDGRKWDANRDDFSNGFCPPKFCRACVLSRKDSKVCGECSEYICPKCTKENHCLKCCKCRKDLCRVSFEGCFIACSWCARVFCGSCAAKADGECEITLEEFPQCRHCQLQTRSGMDDPSNDEEE